MFGISKLMLWESNTKLTTIVFSSALKPKMTNYTEITGHGSPNDSTAYFHRAKMRPTVITLRPAHGSSLKQIKLIAPARYSNLLSNKYTNFVKVEPCGDPPPYTLQNGPASSAILVPNKKIPRPPNAFMIFANEWRKKLSQEYPGDSNKTISVRLGQLWKTMTKDSKDVYYQRSLQAGQDHKQKYPGYVYNPKEARMRKALREQSRARNALGTPARWTKHALTMNSYRQSLVSPVLISQHQRCPDDNKMLHEQIDRDSNMLHSYPDYLDLPYNIPSSDYPLENQPWYPYIQPGAQTNGSYLGRASENKLPVDWSTPYNSEQGNFIRASPQSSPYSMQNHQEVNNLMLNGDGGQPEQSSSCENSCLAVEHKPIVDQIINHNNDNSVVKDPEQQVKELLASAKVICEDSSMMNGKQEDSGSTRLPGFHQAFGSTEIGRFSQPDGFFEAAVAAENERKLSPEVSEFTFSFSPGSSTWTSFLSHPKSPKPEPDLFGFQEQEDYITSACQFSEPNHLYTFDSNFYDSEQVLADETLVKVEIPESYEFEPQDLSAVTSVNQPPVIISQNDNCCVVLESSAMDSGVKEYFSL